MKHGHGVLATAESYFEGEWNYNKMQGQGILTDRVGRFEGKFDAGLKDGEGTLYYYDGGVFRGIFSRNFAVKGELTLPDGTRLDGEWKDRFSGKGVISYSNGDVF